MSFRCGRGGVGPHRAAPWLLPLTAATVGDRLGPTQWRLPSVFDCHRDDSRATLSSACLAILLALGGCGREAGPPSPPSGGIPPAIAEGDEAPVRALYLCDNRFILINAHPYPVRVTWRVQGTDEQGEQTLV